MKGRIHCNIFRDERNSFNGNFQKHWMHGSLTFRHSLTHRASDMPGTVLFVDSEAIVVSETDETTGLLEFTVWWGKRTYSVDHWDGTKQSNQTESELVAEGGYFLKRDLGKPLWGGVIWAQPWMLGRSQPYDNLGSEHSRQRAESAKSPWHRNKLVHSVTESRALHLGLSACGETGCMGKPTPLTHQAPASQPPGAHMWQCRFPGSPQTYWFRIY